jgi:hypothetical protein
VNLVSFRLPSCRAWQRPRPRCSGARRSTAGCSGADASSARCSARSWARSLHGEPNGSPTATQQSANKGEPTARLGRTCSRKDWQRFCSGKCADAESYAKRQKKAAEARAARPPRIPKPPAPTYAKKCEVCGTGYEAKKETSRSCINLECRQEISVRVRAAATLDAMHALSKRCELPACGAEIRETRNPDGTLNLWLHKRRRFCDGSCAGKYGAERARQQRAAAAEAGRTAA